jgi:hypothetical protein
MIMYSIFDLRYRSPKIHQLGAALAYLEKVGRDPDRRAPLGAHARASSRPDRARLQTIASVGLFNNADDISKLLAVTRTLA